MAKSYFKNAPKLLDILLIVLALYIVVTTCRPSAAPKPSAESSVEKVQSEAVKALAETADSLLPSPDATVGETVVDEQTAPVGFEPESFGNACCDPNKGACLPGQPMCNTEDFTQSPEAAAPAAPAAPVAPSCPQTLLYTEKTLPTADTEANCWPKDRPFGWGAVTGECLGDGKSEVANFYDEEQTNTVVKAIENDVSRKMKNRPSQQYPNYSYRADPEIPWGGYPSLSFIQGNANIGLKV